MTALAAGSRAAPTPGWVRALAGAAAGLVLLPLLGIVFRVEWDGFVGRVTSEEALTALGLSLRTASVATVLCLVLGVPLGIVLHRMRWRGKSAVRALVLAPLVLPPVVGGLALLYAFGRRGLVGGWFESMGVTIAFSTTAVVLAQTFVAMPFTVLAVESALATRGERLEAVAGTLGARRSTILWRVTLPSLRAALATGAVLAFARALGEFGATLTFAGSLAGVTRTGPLEIYLAREGDPQTAVALGLVLVVLAIAVVVIAFRPLGRGR
jgi:molybdate transport system permease protein